MQSKNARQLLLSLSAGMDNVGSMRAERSRNQRSRRERLTVPRRKSDQRFTPRWSPRSAFEQRPMRRIRCDIADL